MHPIVTYKNVDLHYTLRPMPTAVGMSCIGARCCDTISMEGHLTATATAIRGIQL